MADAIVQEMFEDWWHGKMWEYNEAWGKDARALAKSMPADAKRYADALGLKLTKEMKQAVKKGTL